MEELRQAPTDGVGDAIVVPPVLSSQFELKIGLLNLVTAISSHGFENDDPHSHIRRFTKITQTVKLNQVPHDIIKLILFPFSLEGATRTWLEKEPPNSIRTWNDLVSKFGESFTDAWDRFKDLLNKCPRHDFSPLHQIDTFYNGLNQSDQDSLNSIAGGNFLTRNTQEALTIIENKSKAIQEGCETCGGPHPYYECQAAGGYTQEVYATTGNFNSGGNADQPQGNRDLLSYRSNNFLGPPRTAHVPNPGIQPVSPPKPKEDPKPNPHQPKIPYLSRLNKTKLLDKNDFQVSEFLKILKQIHFDTSLIDALTQIPKYHKVLKDLLKDNEKLVELANTPINAECSAILLNKVPEKLKDPVKFLIPCLLQDLEVCNSLADSGASINLVPLLMYEKLGIGPLKPTRMTLELDIRSVTFPMGIAEDVIVKVDKFNFLVDFIIVDFETDPRVPIILGRPFLRTAKSRVDLYEEKLTLRVGKEVVMFYIDKSSRINLRDIQSVHCINIIDFSKDKLIRGSTTSHSNLSLPSYESFCFDIEEKSSGSTTSHSNHSLPEYESFCFDVDHIKEKSSGTTTSHSDLSLLEYESFHFDLSIDPLPPADRRGVRR
ncbi:reverse transcriptase domain-containing protein [Tanacetum coccineum]